MGAAASSDVLPCCTKAPNIQEALPLEEGSSVLVHGGSLASSALAPITPVSWVKAADTEGVQAFRLDLEQFGIDTSTFGKRDAKPLELLFHELQEQLTFFETAVSPTSGEGTVRQVIEQVDIILVASVDGTEHVLVTADKPQFSPARKQLVSQRLRPEQKWREGLTLCLERCFQLDRREQARLLSVDEKTYSYREEESQTSRDYPGLPTRSKFHEVVVYVENALDPSLERLGLPELRSFSGMEEDGNPAVRAKLRDWSWEEAAKLASEGVIGERRVAHRRGQRRMKSGLVQALKNIKRQGYLNTEEIAQRAPHPKPLVAGAAQAGQWPNHLLASLVVGARPDRDAMARAAARIRDRDYSLRAFFEDCSEAFPELRLYLPPRLEETEDGCQGVQDRANLSQAAHGEKTAFLDDEYQRTIGALFSFYWLMRLDMDGRGGFCYGVDDCWRARTPPTVAAPGHRKPFAKMSKVEKRRSFYDDGPWEGFRQLLLDAGLWRAGEGGAVSMQLDRVVAMLALTAVHDIMKVEELVPEVSPAHAPFGPYREHEEIGDHDLALGYLLEYFPELIPSVYSLPCESRRLVLLTQSKMEYNHGWMAQAEGPPGKLLRTFKSALQQNRLHDNGGKAISQQDVAFYFVHWLTDLAGAVPMPLSGCEKFVIQFPHSLLLTFMKSFPVLQRLAVEDETTVYEAYLKMRWTELQPPLPSLHLSTGPEAICRCRLLCMAQNAADQILGAFDRLSYEDRCCLSEEMAMTGCRGQQYGLCTADAPRTPGAWKAGLIPVCGEPTADASERAGLGPAFLVYYGPALLQRNGASDPDTTLQMLIAIYRAGRALWPSSCEGADETVTLRIDTLKESSIDEVRNSMHMGEVWLLVWHSSHEAFVERHPLRMLNDLNRSLKPYQVLILLQGEQLQVRRCRVF